MKLELRNKDGEWVSTEHIIRPSETFKATEDRTLVRLNGAELLLDSGYANSDYANLLKTYDIKGITLNYIPELDMTTIIVDKHAILGAHNIDVALADGGPYELSYYCGESDDTTTIMYYREIVDTIKAKYL